VIIDHRLSFTQHVNVIVSRAHARASLIHKYFLSRDRATLVRAFIIYVRPILEYASSVWSPFHVADVRKIEAVQRRFTKRLSGLAEFNYSTRLAILELDSLEPRLLHLDLVLAYKLIFGLAEIESYTLFEFRSDCITRGHDYKLTAHNNRVNVRKWYFSQRLINVWNSLLVNADCIASLSRFKSFLVKADLSAFLLLPLND
jgi:hypothetical protein